MSAWTTVVGRAVTPALWWRLADTTGTACADASGSAHPGVRSGSTITTGVAGGLFGDTDTAMSFTGTNPIAQVAFGAWAETTLFSVTCWFKVVGTLAVNNVLVGRDSQAGGRRFQLALDASGHVVWVIHMSTGAANTLTTTSTYNDAAWHMVTCTYNQSLSTSTRQAIYVDNTTTPVLGGGTSPINNTGTTVSFSVGNLPRTNQTPANSTVDEVLYWTATAFTGAQHRALWLAGATGVVYNPVTLLSTGAPLTVWDGTAWVTVRTLP